MADVAAAEMKIRKAVKETRTINAKLVKELDARALDSPLKAVNPSKVAGLIKAVNTQISKLDAISKFRKPSVYQVMSPEAQNDLDWAGGALNAMLIHQADLNKAAKMIDQNPKAIISKIEKDMKRWKEAMKGLRTIQKQIEKGYDPVKKEFSNLSVLPALLMLIIMGLTLKKWLKS